MVRAILHVLIKSDVEDLTTIAVRMLLISQDRIKPVSVIQKGMNLWIHNMVGAIVILVLWDTTVAAIAYVRKGKN